MVSNRNDEYLLSLDSIDQSIRESFQEIPPVFPIVDWREQWKSPNPIQSGLYFVKKITPKPHHLIIIIYSGRFHFFVGGVMEFYFRHRSVSRASRRTWSAVLVMDAPTLIS